MLMFLGTQNILTFKWNSDKIFIDIQRCELIINNYKNTQNLKILKPTITLKDIPLKIHPQFTSEMRKFKNQDLSPFTSSGVESFYSNFNKSRVSGGRSILVFISCRRRPMMIINCPDCQPPSPLVTRLSRMGKWVGWSVNQLAGSPPHL